MYSTKPVAYASDFNDDDPDRNDVNDILILYALRHPNRLKRKNQKMKMRIASRAPLDTDDIHLN